MKNNNQKTFKVLTAGAEKCLKERLKRSPGTLRHYSILWNRIRYYMESQGIQFLDSAVCNAFLEHAYSKRDFNDLTKRDRDMIKAVEVLIEFINTGTVSPRKEAIVLNGAIGSLMTRYLAFKENQRLARHTLDEYAQHLSRFLAFLTKKDIKEIKAVNQLHILQYLKEIDPKYPSLPFMAIRAIRGLFIYLYEQELLEIDLSLFIPKTKNNKQPKLPSTYRKHEIETLIRSVDRSSRTGKRNYAIILLASRLGLRASDIRDLKFDEIHWERNIIGIKQYKTSNILELPLLSEVGNAIIDYLKYGRPVSSEPYVFLVARSPYNPMSSSGVGAVVQNTFTSANIDIQNRKHGSHALRHSLAGFLLENKVTLPVISEVLGHENTESTRFYLRIDLNSFKKCMLDVPAVDKMFYLQKGGYFYE